MSNKKRPTFADFFCGAGGFSEGFYQAGFNLVFALDNWKPATQTHDLNHSKCKTMLKDILKLDTIEKIDESIPDVDVVIGSPPCVSFSNANKSGKADKSLGIKLIEQFLKIVLWKKYKWEQQPKNKQNLSKFYWVMENVPNSLKYIKEVYTWKDLGLPECCGNLEIPKELDVEEKPVRNTPGFILKASDYGAPQDRSRGVCGNFPYKLMVKKQKITIQDIFNMLGAPLEKKNQYNDILYKNKKHKTITDHLYDTEIPEKDWKNSKRMKTDHGYMGKMSFPDDANRPSRTVMATMSCSTREAIIFKKENCENKYRTPTIREIACFMGYPIDYQFEGHNDSVKHKQIGNAVCPPLAKEIGISILNQEGLLDVFKPLKRVIQNAKNLNGISNPISNEIKKKSIKSKFHIHVPELKLNSYRVELDNISSNLYDYSKEDMLKKLDEQGFNHSKEKAEVILQKFIEYIDVPFKWKTVIHLGAGKDATKAIPGHEVLKPYIEDTSNLDNLQTEMTEINVSDSFRFQKALCNIDTEYMSPQELLDKVAELVKKYGIDDKMIDMTHCSECKEVLKEKKKEIPHKIILAQWILSYLLNQ